MGRWPLPEGPAGGVILKASSFSNKGFYLFVLHWGLSFRSPSVSGPRDLNLASGGDGARRGAVTRMGACSRKSPSWRLLASQSGDPYFGPGSECFTPSLLWKRPVICSNHCHMHPSLLSTLVCCLVCGPTSGRADCDIVDDLIHVTSHSPVRCRDLTPSQTFGMDLLPSS